MKTNLRGKIREFVQSEEGKVGIKSPLALGIGQCFACTSNYRTNKSHGLLG